MTFEEVEKRYRALRKRFASGELSEADFKAKLQDLMIEDDQGRWWMIGYETGQWYFSEGEAWVPGEPPRRAPSQTSRPARNAWRAIAIVAALVVLGIGIVGLKALGDWRKSTQNLLSSTTSAPPVTTAASPPATATPPALATIATRLTGTQTPPPPTAIVIEPIATQRPAPTPEPRPTETPKSLGLYQSGVITYLGNAGDKKAVYVLNQDGTSTLLAEGISDAKVLAVAPDRSYLAIALCYSGALSSMQGVPQFVGGCNPTLMVVPARGGSNKELIARATALGATYLDDGRLLIGYAEDVSLTQGRIIYQVAQRDGSQPNDLYISDNVLVVPPTASPPTPPPP